MQAAVRDRRPPFAGASTPGDEVPDGAGDASPGPQSMRAQREGGAALIAAGQPIPLDFSARMEALALVDCVLIADSKVGSGLGKAPTRTYLSPLERSGSGEHAWSSLGRRR